MSIYTDRDGGPRLSVLAVGALCAATVLLAVFASNGKTSLVPWAWGIGALTVFVAVFALPGWITALWGLYVKKLPEDEIEERRGTVNAVMGFLAFLCLCAIAYFLFHSDRPPSSSGRWSETIVGVGIVAGLFYIMHVHDEVRRLRRRCDELDRRIALLTRRDYDNFDEDWDG